ncbi:MAG: tRNA uridine-5-carboxymethylaminomethyl(34) synthesis GTPase MnmE [Alphaproteobacteria bacterium]|nr:tRNA uridine-5-carboxymethylaminomethyl(34) synthesis GTPase MnmE [Alphaproteobacteria bacterium]MBV9905649.1 tRNA uridine-5-carboxymethylaminomethyl(34) synthesis GTPase MnmE [Alphaproteobacteria bacterium]
MSDTIYALSSAPGRAGVAVVRVSGPSVGAVVRALCGALPTPRRAVVRTLAGAGGWAIDEALVLWMPGPKSFTGEDVCEFHVHGGRAIVEAVMGTIGAVRGTRPAEPGEFTRRAVENGKLDLTRAEAVIDLVDAETEAQRRQALRQYGGGLEALYDGWRERLVRALAWTEADIDFADEDMPGGVAEIGKKQAIELVEEIQYHLADGRRGEIVRDGLFLTVIGPPNAGKSSLINALAQRDVAIVAETAGTTRDIIEVRLNIGGYAVIVADTAGLRDARDAVESEGVRRALARAEQSDLVLLLLDGSAPDPFAGLPPDTRERAHLVVWNKVDLPSPAPRDGLAISAKLDIGLNGLLARLTALVAERLETASEAPVITRARHRHALTDAVKALERAVAMDQTELFAEDMRLAMRAIGRITGRVDVEELLDVVFRDFCIGK